MPTATVLPDTYVTIEYALFEDGHGGPASGADPVKVSYVHGYGQVLPIMERALSGKSVGDRLTVVAAPEDAFGLHEADGVFEIDRDGLEGAADLSAGDEIVATTDEGDMVLRIVEVREDALLVDTNHPLAGCRVRFDVRVIDVRPATEAEIEEAQAELDHEEACGCGAVHSAPGSPAAAPLVQIQPKKN